MRLAAVLVMLTVAGCPQPDIVTVGPAPQARPRPASRVVEHWWHCAYGIAGPICASSRSACLNSVDRNSSRVTAISCPPQDAAICIDYYKVVEGRWLQLCWSSIEACVDSERLLRRSYDYSSVSGCYPSRTNPSTPRFLCAVSDGSTDAVCNRDRSFCEANAAEMLKHGVQSARCVGARRAFCFVYRDDSGLVFESCASGMERCRAMVAAVTSPMTGCTEE